MDFKEFAARVLSGGLPAVLDNPNAQSNGMTYGGDTRTEQRAPSGTLTDRDTFENQLVENKGVRYLAIGVAFFTVGIALFAVLSRR